MREGAPLSLWRDAQGTAYGYHVTPTGEACIHSCRPAGDAVVMPSSIDGMPVGAIGIAALAGIRGVRRIVCAPGIHTVGSRAFDGCPDLEELILPDALDHFDYFWIRGCDKLALLQLPGAIEAIKDNPFRGTCPRKLVIGAGTRRIDSAAFLNDGLEEVAVDPRNPWLSSDGLSILDREGRVFHAMAVRAETCTVPDGCEVIGRKAFAYNKTVREVVLPDTVVQIEPYAFVDCLVGSFSAPPRLRSIGEKAFYQCRALSAVELDDELAEIGPDAFSKTALRSLHVPAGVSSIGAGALSCPSMDWSGGGQPVSVDPGNERYFVDASGGLYERLGGGRGQMLVEMLDGDSER